MKANDNLKGKYIDPPKTDLTVNPGFVEETRVFKMIGDSMDNNKKGSVHHGDLLTVVRISSDNGVSTNRAKNKFRIYMFQTRWGLMVKEVTRIEEHSVFCRSLNPNKDLYPDFEIEFSDISAIYEVISVSRTL